MCQAETVSFDQTPMKAQIKTFGEKKNGFVRKGKRITPSDFIFLTNRQKNWERKKCLKSAVQMVLWKWRIKKKSQFYSNEINLSPLIALLICAVELMGTYCNYVWTRLKNFVNIIHPMALTFAIFIHDACIDIGDFFFKLYFQVDKYECTAQE